MKRSKPYVRVEPGWTRSTTGRRCVEICGRPLDQCRHAASWEYNGGMAYCTKHKNLMQRAERMAAARRMG